MAVRGDTVRVCVYEVGVLADVQLLVSPELDLRILSHVLIVFPSTPQSSFPPRTALLLHLSPRSGISGPHVVRALNET